MQMRMHEGLSPRVQDGEEPEHCAQMLGISGSGTVKTTWKYGIKDLRFPIVDPGCAAE